MTHLRPDELEALVRHDAAALPAERLRHLAGCPECAQALAQAARFEEELYELGSAFGEKDSASREHPAGRRAVLMLWFAAAAALAVATGWWVFAESGRERPGSLVERREPATMPSVPRRAAAPGEHEVSASFVGMDFVAPLADAPTLQP